MGQSLGGSFAFEKAGDTTQADDHRRVPHARRRRRQRPPRSTATIVLSAAGVAGHLSAAIAVNAGSAFELSGSFGLALNTTAAAVGDLPAGPYLRFEATGVTLRVAGQRITGDLAVESLTTDQRRRGQARRWPTSPSASATARRTC